MSTDNSYYWGFRQIRLGKSLENSRLDPGVAVLKGPYVSEKEAERDRLHADSDWDAATSHVFEASSEAEAQAKVEGLTPRKDNFPTKETKDSICLLLYPHQR